MSKKGTKRGNIAQDHELVHKAVNHLKTSVIVPSKGSTYLKYLLRALRNQRVKPYEVVLVLKNCDQKEVEKLCQYNDINYIIIEQRYGYFTHALNVAKRASSGDILIFTDNDAIPPKKWIEKYVELHEKNPRVACICSRDIYIDLRKMRLLPTPDDRPIVRAYRWFIRSWLEQAHPLLKKYHKGIYLTKKLEIAHGRCIPNKTCYSLPFRGVNMSFKKEALEGVEFPEHPLLKAAPGNEQYIGLQVILKGWESLYVPNNPVLHVMHQSLSRIGNKNAEMFKKELEVMRIMYLNLLNSL